MAIKQLEIQGSDTVARSEWLRGLLTTNVCNITFTKVNGEARTMPCTLKEGLLPAPPVHVTNTDNPIDFPQAKERKKNPDNISVWCTDKNEWRSFKIMNVTGVEVL